jgi:hypothetical protein
MNDPHTQTTWGPETRRQAVEYIAKHVLPGTPEPRCYDTMVDLMYSEIWQPNG